MAEIHFGIGPSHITLSPSIKPRLNSHFSKLRLYEEVSTTGKTLFTFSISTEPHFKHCIKVLMAWEVMSHKIKIAVCFVNSWKPIFIAKATKLYITQTFFLCAVKIFRSVRFDSSLEIPWYFRTVRDGKLIHTAWEPCTRGGKVSVWLRWV